jgi:hypothetical protein
MRHIFAVVGVTRLCEGSYRFHRHRTIIFTDSISYTSATAQGLRMDLGRYSYHLDCRSQRVLFCVGAYEEDMRSTEVQYRLSWGHEVPQVNAKTHKTA